MLLRLRRVLAERLRGGGGSSLIHHRSTQFCLTPHPALPLQGGGNIKSTGTNRYRLAPKNPYNGRNSCPASTLFRPTKRGQSGTVLLRSWAARGAIASLVLLVPCGKALACADFAAAPSTRWSVMSEGGAAWLRTPCGDRF